ncbi:MULTISPECIES: DUF418 domain-containing protein [Actinopolyspora]|uniref:Uncharacterized membrane protein YeiB n=1 Tax=Actinopolyspora saharensis TaxID=995062 RepID=A0A1H0Y205_9ACTN|nr:MULTISPECIES: DUF418 domain-containing protein [Actinopolyspora]SDQ09123.1 Uncharacterized membrane protein YeiB [Actinopolyspora saharensis]
MTELDALRGFALCGIIFVNVPGVMHMTGTVDGAVQPVRHVLDLLVQQRFFPLFSLLFGISFALMLRSARDGHSRSEAVLARRLLFLVALGALHHLLQPGEALLYYGIGGLVFLLPLTRAPLWLNGLLAGGLTVAGVTLTSGGIALVPGLLLAGFVIGRTGLLHRTRQSTTGLATAFCVSLLLATSGLLWQEQEPLSAGFTRSSAIAGLCLAAVYSTGLLLVLRTPTGRWLSDVLEPLGRTALTNYVGATLIFVPTGHLTGLWQSSHWGGLLGLCAGILAVQAIASNLWLKKFRYGPLEWVWRWVTWWHPVPLRKDTSSARFA